MPEVKNCRKCKRIFMYTTGPQICEACKKQEEDEFEKVRLFVRDFPGATIQEVARETEVPIQLIYRFLKEGKLEVTEGSAIALQCENCGARIKSGRFCIECSKRLAKDMIQAGRSLQDSVRNESMRDKEPSGLRYMHGERKD